MTPCYREGQGSREGKHLIQIQGARDALIAASLTLQPVLCNIMQITFILELSDSRI